MGLVLNFIMLKKWLLVLVVWLLLPFFSYLCLLVGLNMWRVKSWNTMLQKFKKLLANGELTYSLRGQFNFNQVYSWQLVHFYFLIFNVPKVMINVLEILSVRFFWYATNKERKIAWASRIKFLILRRKVGMQLEVWWL